MKHHKHQETYKPTKAENKAILAILTIVVFSLIGILLGVRG